MEDPSQPRQLSNPQRDMLIDDDGVSNSTISHDEYFGEEVSLRCDKILRIGHININGIPESKEDSKNDRIRQAINDHDMQIIGISETNRCWHLLNEEDRWISRIKGWWETSKSSVAYNVKDGELSTPYQPGGTLVLSVGEPAHRVIEIGRDTTGLGRWSWTRYRGKHDVILQVISA